MKNSNVHIQKTTVFGPDNLSIFFSVAISLLLFGATFCFFGFFYGWLDDALIANYFQGIILHQPIDHAIGCFFLLAQLFVKLYRFVPSVPWYGTLMGFWMFLATVNFLIFVLNYIIPYLTDKKWLAVLLCILLYQLIWIENVYLINFTRTAVLLMGTSFLNLVSITYKNQRGKYYWLIASYFMCTFLLGLFLRMEVVYILLPFFVIYIFIQQKNKAYRTIAALMLCLLVFKAAEKYFFPQDVAPGKKIAHILNIVDGLNTYNPNLDLLATSPKNLALFYNYFPDSTSVSDVYLKSIGPASPIDLIGVKYFWRNLNSEILKSVNYTAEYHHPLNWFWKTVCFVFFNLVILGLSFFYVMKNRLEGRLFMLQILLVTAFLITALLITVLAKMEDRVLNPALIIFTMGYLAVWLQHNNIVKGLNSKAFLCVLTIVLAASATGRTLNYLVVANQKNDELKLKKSIIDELNVNFNNKLIFFDVWTMSVLHQSPLDKIKLNPSNTYTAYGDYFSNFQPAHVQYLKDMCGKTDFISFYKCLYERRSNVVFVFSKQYRKELIEKYAKDVYGQKIAFKEINANSKLSRLHYSFLWVRQDFKYYTLDKSFEDAQLP